MMWVCFLFKFKKHYGNTISFKEEEGEEEEEKKRWKNSSKDLFKE